MIAPASRRGHGFTLVEVLVALMIMAVMAAMAQRGVQALQTAKQAGQDRMERSLRLATVLTQFEQDLSALYDAEAQRAPPAVAFDGATLRLLRRGPDGAQLVAWSLKGGRFLRWAGGPPLLTLSQLEQAWQRSQLLDGSEREQVVALEGVHALQVYFWWGSAWSNAQSTGNLAVAGGGAQVPPPSPAASQPVPRPPSTRQGVPRGVRLVLTLAGGGQVTRDILMGPQP